MSLIPLYGYIPNPNIEGGGEVLYIIKETEITSNEYYYEGVIGYGFHEHDFALVPESVIFDSKTGKMSMEQNLNRAINNPEFPLKYIPTDMREFKFRYNKETKYVTVDTYWRYEMYDVEAKSLLKNVESDDIDDSDDVHISYPYFRFPRTKSGIAISRVFNKLFDDKDIKIFVPKKLLA